MMQGPYSGRATQAGLLEAGLSRTGVKPTATVVMRSGQDFDIDISW
jgi:hypothetical protein